MTHCLYMRTVMYSQFDNIPCPAYRSVEPMHAKQEMTSLHVVLDSTYIWALFISCTTQCYKVCLYGMANAWWPALAECSSECAVQACSEALLSAKISQPTTTVCPCLKFPVANVCYLPKSTVSSTCSTQNVCAFFCCWTKRLEFIAWGSSKSSCWLWTF